MARPRQDINISAIAAEAGVSASTVSRVLNGRAGISEATRERILAISDRHGFRPRYTTGRPPKIAVLSPEKVLSNYLRKAMAGILGYSWEHPVEIGLLISPPQRRQSLLEQLREQQYQGAIVLLPNQFKGKHAELVRSGLPVIFLDAQVKLKGASYVGHDAYAGSYAAAEYLIGLGHRRIGYLGFEHAFPSHEQRFKAYRDAMKAHRLKVLPSWVLEAVQGEDGQASEGDLPAARLLERASELTAIMAADDMLAMQALTACQRAGKRVPEELSVVGFDNIAEAEAWYPALTTVNHPADEAGYLAVKAICEAIQHPGETTLPQTVLPADLVVRESCAPPRS